MTARIPTYRYLPGVVADADRCFAQLAAETAWSDRMRARRTASFGEPYDYSGQHYDAAPMPPVLAALAAQCAAHAGHAFDNCLLNYYASGRNTMGFHYDAYDQLEPASWIAVASLGAARPLVFRSADQLALHQVTLEPGSLLLMNRATQDAWLHAIPRTPGAGPRISATFRQFVPAARR